VTQMSGQRATVSEHPASGGSRIRQRQRLRLIDACISALHIYGPSRTTVEKVVALADLSPGIVRFYFDSKAAMLVASLEHLAAEFGERVLVPVARLKDNPVQALRLLVNLYLDADIASPRKVSVWYAFWGEASARQEYQDICGKKDEEFAALVRELMERMIAVSGAGHLDADAVALGLIGVLEVLWQGFAFESEANIDRRAAAARSLAYLRSVFPGEFGPADGAGARLTAASAPATPGRGTAAGAGDAGNARAGSRLPGWVYADAALFAAEREQLLRPAWQLVGHEAELRLAGDFLTADLAGERVLVVLDERGRRHALSNTCRQRPHALVSTRRGHLRSAIHCTAHSLTYGFDGRLVAGTTPGDLTGFELALEGRLILVRAGGAGGPEPAAAAWGGCAALLPQAVTDTEVAADWKVIVEQWLESEQPQQLFVAPNHLLDVRGTDATILQVVPSAPGRSRIRRFDFSAARRSTRRARRGPHLSWRRETDAALRAQIELAESTQAGLMSAAGDRAEADPAETTALTPGLARFRESVAALLPGLAP
jgi:TetR/AcrR family transcriptional regulator, transcriptional repressor of bet genes